MPTVPGSCWPNRGKPRDERNGGCCEQPNVWDEDPGKHPDATVPDLTGLDWPPVRLGWNKRKIGSCDPARGCPRVEPTYERARFTERELMVLKGRRGERVSFEGARRNAWQSPATSMGPANLDLDYVFGAAWVLQPRCEPPRRSGKATVKGSDCNDQTKRKIFGRETPYLDIRGHLRVRPATQPRT
jgi:hypothetical protein